MGKYCSSSGYGRQTNGDETASLADEMGLVDGGTRSMKQLLPAHDNCEEDSITEDLDIGELMTW